MKSIMPNENKIKLRLQLLEQRQARRSADYAKINHGIFENLLREDGLKSCKVIFVYISTIDEIDTRNLLDFALKNGNTVCVPLCEDKGKMTARQIHSLSELSPGKYLEILEPRIDSLTIAPEEIDLVIAPCLAVDADGYRLGYGGGYYDCFLAKTMHAMIWTLCANECILPTIYREAHDIPCDKIITERGVILPHEK